MSCENVYNDFLLEDVTIYRGLVILKCLSNDKVVRNTMTRLFLGRITPKTLKYPITIRSEFEIESSGSLKVGLKHKCPLWWHSFACYETLYVTTLGPVARR